MTVNSLQIADDTSGFLVGSYHCGSPGVYLDLQEFVEDSIFDFLDKSNSFPENEFSDVFPFELKRQYQWSSLEFAINVVLRKLNIERPEICLDTPYVYTAVGSKLAIIALDTGHQYITVFVLPGKV